MTRPDPIRTDARNAFAHRSMQVRVPAIIRETARRNPDYAQTTLYALEGLAHAIETDALIPPPDSTLIDGGWAASWTQHAGETWLNAAWFFAEVYVYRLVVDICGWHTSGRDPFAPYKREELRNPELVHQIEAMLSLNDLPAQARIAAMLKADLWSNRMDLSLASAKDHGTAAHDDDLIADDSAAIVRHLAAHEGGAIHFITDNAAAEFLHDLVLIDALLNTFAGTITVQVKHHPTFVSDVWTDDIALTMQFLRGFNDPEESHFPYSPALLALGERLNAFQRSNRLRFTADIMWNNGLFLHQFPRDVLESFAGSALVLFKGDANYRRVTDDAIWDDGVSFAQATEFFPAPLAVLRTLKSDGVVGLPEGTAARLQSRDQSWRISGKYGVIQFKP
jgi:uncharacterized protein with ATP-grasp and redox domains